MAGGLTLTNGIHMARMKWNSNSSTPMTRTRPTGVTESARRCDARSATPNHHAGAQAKQPLVESRWARARGGQTQAASALRQWQQPVPGCPQSRRASVGCDSCSQRCPYTSLFSRPLWHDTPTAEGSTSRGAKSIHLSKHRLLNTGVPRAGRPYTNRARVLPRCLCCHATDTAN